MGRQGFLYSSSANQMSSVLIMATAALQTSGPAVYSLRKAVAMRELCTGVYNYTVAHWQAAVFWFWRVLEMGASRRCRIVLLNPSSAVQYVERNSCWSYWYCKGYTQLELWSLGGLWADDPSVRLPVTCSIQTLFSGEEVLSLMKKSVLKHELFIKTNLEYLKLLLKSCCISQVSHSQ